MKQLHLEAMRAYLRGDLKQWDRKPIYRPEHFYALTNEYDEDNAVKAFHMYVVTYFGGDYERAQDFVKKLIQYRKTHDST